MTRVSLLLLLLLAVGASCANEPRVLAAPEAAPADGRLERFEAPELDAFLADLGLPVVAPPLPPLEVGTCRAFERALASLGSERTADAFGTVGLFFDEYDRPAVAEACFLEATRLDPDAPAWWHFRGHLAEERGDLDAAIEHFDRAAGDTEPDEAACVRLVRALGRAGRSVERRGALRRLLAVAPRSLFGLTEAAEEALEEGDVERAERFLRRAYAEDPDQRRTNQIFARLHAEAGRTIEAERHAARVPNGKELGLLSVDRRLAAAQRTVDTLFALRARVDALRGERRWDELVPALEELERRAPSATNLVGLAQAELFRGRFDPAEGHVEAALSADPTLPDAHAVAGRLALRRGDPARGLGHLGRALELDAGSRVARELRTKCLLALERHGEALAEAYELVRRVPDQVGPELLVLEVHRTWHEAAAAVGNGPEADRQRSSVAHRLRQLEDRFPGDLALERVRTWLASAPGG